MIRNNEARLGEHPRHRAAGSVDAMSAKVAILAGAGGALGHPTAVTLAAGPTEVAFDRNERGLDELSEGVRRLIDRTTAEVRLLTFR